jgi:hypothetical protein
VPDRSGGVNLLILLALWLQGLPERLEKGCNAFLQQNEEKQYLQRQERGLVNCNKMFQCKKR